MKNEVTYISTDGECVVALPWMGDVNKQRELEIDVLGCDIQKQLTTSVARERAETNADCELCYYKTTCSEYSEGYPDDTEACERYTEVYLFDDGSSHTQTASEGDYDFDDEE